MRYISDDTISAISTPPGKGAIGIVRLSGKSALGVLYAFFKPSCGNKGTGAKANIAQHGWIEENGQKIDEVVVTVFLGPRSYTGEDMAEISAHGSPLVLEKIVELCLNAGARRAERGEFAYRAYINGKLDLARAESVMELVQSRSPFGAKAAANQLSGKLSEKVKAWRKKLVDLLARLEVGLDYAEEDITFIKNDELRLSVEELLENVQKLFLSSKKGALLRDGVKIAIIGKPNSGKSSLLNALLERDRSIVTDIPGTTRDIIEEPLLIKGVPAVISDTAGIRAHSLDPVEKIGQKLTRQAIRSSDVLLWIIDSSVPLTKEDKAIASMITKPKKEGRVIAVLNKTDLKTRASEQNARKLAGSLAPMIKISAKKEIGIEDLEAEIYKLCGISADSPENDVLLTLRHKDVLARARNSLSETLGSIIKGETEEMTAHHIRETLNALGEITGENVTEEVLTKVFSKFCVGK